MDALRTIAEWRTPFLDNLFLVLTKLGEELVVIAVMALLYWCISKKVAYGLGFAYFFSAVTVNTLKITCRIDRPWILDPAFNPVEAAKGHATSYSFPSGHTQSATALYGTLGMTVKNGWLRALFFLCIPVVGFSRMYLGVHTPADVLASFGVTAAFVLLFSVFCHTDRFTARFVAITSSLLTLFGVGALIYALNLYASGTIAYDYASDISKIVGSAIGFAIGSAAECSFVRFSTRTAHLWQQAIKMVVGLSVTVGIKSGLKPLFALIDSDSLIFDALRYALITVWIVVIWPAIFSRIFKAPQTAAEAAAIEETEEKVPAE